MDVWRLDLSLYLCCFPDALRLRVMAALGLMVGSKLVTISVPFVFKELINTYNAAGDIVGLGDPTTTIPLALVLGYGIARTTGNGFQELRNTVFSVVAQQAIRNMAKDVFRHLLHLDMQYHLNKNSGALFRTIDRGTVLVASERSILISYMSSSV